MVKKTARTNAGIGFVFNDDYLDDILGDSEPYVQLRPSEKAQLESEEENVYTVEKILSKKKEGRKSLYLVKWEGFTEKDNTWEPLSNLTNVREMVRDFDLQHDLMTNMHQPNSHTTGNGNMLSTLSVVSADNQNSAISPNSKAIKKPLKVKQALKTAKQSDLTDDSARPSRGRPKKQQKQQKPEKQQENTDNDNSEIQQIEQQKQLLAQQQQWVIQQQLQLQQQEEQAKQKHQQIQHQQEQQKQQEKDQEQQKVPPTNSVKNFFAQRKRVKAPQPLQEHEDIEQTEEHVTPQKQASAKPAQKGASKPKKRRRGPNRKTLQTKKLESVTEKDSEDTSKGQQEDKPLCQMEIIETNYDQMPETGSFDTDKPSRIVMAKLSQNMIYVTLEWEPRPNGFKPENSVFSNEQIKDKCPRLLVNFYETRINFNKHPSRQQANQQ